MELFRLLWKISIDNTDAKRALVGALTPAIDMQLSDRYSHAQRGNAR